MNDRDTMLAKLRDDLNSRADAQGWRDRKGKLTTKGNRAALEAIIGAAAAINALGVNDTHSIIGIAFICSTRDADEFLKEK
jgi:hypothetical protein